MTMKKRVALLPLLLIAACATAPETQGPATVVDPLVGKQLTAGSTILFLNADGTMSGSDGDGNALVGTYTADATEICSNLTEPARFAGERCSVPVIDGDTVVFNRSNGSQSPVYTIGG